MSEEERWNGGSSSPVCGLSSRSWSGRGSARGSADDDDPPALTTDLERILYVVAVALSALIAVVIALWRR